MEGDTQNSELYYICPECNKEQLVYLTPNVIDDGEAYRFTTACSDCKTELMIKVGFDVETALRGDEDE
ncbi:MAG: hypothetical protein MUP63_03645 [Candidatus Nanohaloarchaeota archaeon QJJ-7]|nr:hypothetical protein [Candidatus Nanohaloarchaeota archaeon QJJ-7]